jgi:hypothetical protein
METEQHSAKKLMDNWSDKERNQNFLESKENENTTY